MPRRPPAVMQSGGSLMVNPMSLTAAKAAYEHGGAWHEALKAYLDGNFAFVKSSLPVSCRRR